MADATPNVVGVKELAAAFKRLGSGFELRAGRAMVASGGAALKAEARALALGYGFKRTGSLIRNIVIKRETRPDVAQSVEYHLGVRHGRAMTKKQRSSGKKLGLRGGRIQQRYDDDPFYWKFLEFGWIPRKIALKGGERKKAAQRAKDAARKIPGRSFIADALKNKRSEALSAMERRLLRELEKHSK